MKIKKFEAAVAVALVLSVLLSVLSFAITSDSIEKDVLRLHILANSDSAEDQSLKIKVRNSVIENESDIFDGVGNVTAAKEKVIRNYDRIKAIAQKVIREEGYDYPVSVRIEKTYFPTRYYESFTLPAGYYEALRIVIGEGKGHNWWCVMYPPLCVGSAAQVKKEYSKLPDREKKLITSNPRYDIRFKTYEIYKKLLKYLKEKQINN